VQQGGGNWKDFFAAAARGDVELVKFHLANGIDADYQHPEVMTTALIEASTYGQGSVVQVLLDHGADPQLRSMMDGWTALEAAVKSDQRAVAEILAEHLGVPTPQPPAPDTQAQPRGVLARLLSRVKGG
jgi:ankyrin repeat protein